MSNVILKPVEVIIYLSKQSLNIVRFKYMSTVYKVSEQTAYWKEKKGDVFIHHYHLICDKEKIVCEISINNTDFECLLVQMDNLD